MITWLSDFFYRCRHWKRACRSVSPIDFFCYRLEFSHRSSYCVVWLAPLPFFLVKEKRSTLLRPFGLHCMFGNPSVCRKSRACCPVWYNGTSLQIVSQRFAYSSGFPPTKISIPHHLYSSRCCCSHEASVRDLYLTTAVRTTIETEYARLFAHIGLPTKMWPIP